MLHYHGIEWTTRHGSSTLCCYCRRYPVQHPCKLELEASESATRQERPFSIRTSLPIAVLSVAIRPGGLVPAGKKYIHELAVTRTRSMARLPAFGRPLITCGIRFSTTLWPPLPPFGIGALSSPDWPAWFGVFGLVSLLHT